jgi:hypothetical protein
MILPEWRDRFVCATSARRCAPFARVCFRPIRSLPTSFAVFVRIFAKPALQSAGSTNMWRQCVDVRKPARAVLLCAVRSLKAGPFGRLHRTQVPKSFDQRNAIQNRPLKPDVLKAIDSIRNHWPEYLKEARTAPAVMWLIPDPRIERRIERGLTITAFSSRHGAWRQSRPAVRTDSIASRRGKNEDIGHASVALHAGTDKLATAE